MVQPARSSCWCGRRQRRSSALLRSKCTQKRVTSSAHTVFMPAACSFSAETQSLLSVTPSLFQWPSKLCRHLCTLSFPGVMCLQSTSESSKHAGATSSGDSCAFNPQSSCSFFQLLSTQVRSAPYPGAMSPQTSTKVRVHGVSTPLILNWLDSGSHPSDCSAERLCQHVSVNWLRNLRRHINWSSSACPVVHSFVASDLHS
mmetsp:Transcript_27489/g.65168  ORF Transcript_27489/g.65168 Transcript_27489/m.65168 type:complete len:201 (-) Transcript_27489:80-682(-)